MTPGPGRLTIATEFLFRVVIETDSRRVSRLGGTPWGGGIDVAVTGGTVTGPRMNGVVLDLGADWGLVTRQGDGSTLSVTDLDCRLMIETGDDPACLIEMRYGGVSYSTSDPLREYQPGDVRDPREYYFCTTPRFRTSAPNYDDLNRTVAIAAGYHRHRAGPIYDVYACVREDGAPSATGTGQ